MAELSDQYENNVGKTEIWKIAVSGLSFGIKFWDMPIVQIMYGDVLKIVDDHPITSKELNKIYRKKLSDVPEYEDAVAKRVAERDDFENELYEISAHDELQEYINQELPNETLLFDVDQEKAFDAGASLKHRRQVQKPQS